MRPRSPSRVFGAYLWNEKEIPFIEEYVKSGSVTFQMAVLSVPFCSISINCEINDNEHSSVFGLTKDKRILNNSLFKNDTYHKIPDKFQIV